MSATNSCDVDLFFDFDEAALPDGSKDAAPYDAMNCFSEDYQIHQGLDDSASTTIDINEIPITGLPQDQKAVYPCDRCHLLALECFIYDMDGLVSSACFSCDVMLHPCSFSTSQGLATPNQDTDPTARRVVCENGDQYSGLTTSYVEVVSLDHGGFIRKNGQGDKCSKSEKSAIRLPHAAIKVLKEWMMQHLNCPYPSEGTKLLLKERTGLSIEQISNWMSNTRRRRKVQPTRNTPLVLPLNPTIAIPIARPWESLNPLERWKHSPTENEPASLAAIAQSASSSEPSQPANYGSYRRDACSSNTSASPVFKAPSESSSITGFTDMSSGSLKSHASALSHESRRSLRSMNGLKSGKRRRRQHLPTFVPNKDLGKGLKRFQCTFCTESFKTKYDWLRHEKSLHLSLEKWICTPLGGIIEDIESGRRKCVYCGALDPSEEHLTIHNHKTCAEKSIESRTYYRKDHFRQHMKLMHDSKMTAAMNAWKSDTQYIKSRCGFCGKSFDTWDQRAAHLAKEFRDGASMKDWKGCRGLDAYVAAHVTNAMPPYLIADESRTPFPFSARSSSRMKNYLQLEMEGKHLGSSMLDSSPTDDLCAAYQDDCDPRTLGPIVLFVPQTHSSDETLQENQNATSWEILTLRLGRFTREHVEKHGPGSVTDKMLQNEARLILYGEVDGWEQTAADNAEWLNLFKKAHGIGTKGPVPGISSYHEVYEDLGIHRDSVLDPSFDVNNIECAPTNQDRSGYGPAP